MNVSKHYRIKSETFILKTHVLEKDSILVKIRLGFVSSRDFIGREWKRVAHARYADAITANYSAYYVLVLE